MQVKKILWPTDLSDTAAAALPWVAELGADFGAEIHLLYVAEDIGFANHIYGDAKPEMMADLQKREFELAKQRMEKTCQEKLDGCPLYHHHLVKGDPPREILRLAQDEGVDLIILASHGHGQQDELAAFFGSVTEKVVRYSAVPVLVVNPGGKGFYPFKPEGVPVGSDEA